MSGLHLDLYNSSGGVQTQGSTSHSTPGANTKIAKMKKLNIFSAANRKTYNSPTRKNSSPVTSPTGDTINRIVSKKEEVYTFIPCYNLGVWEIINQNFKLIFVIVTFIAR